MTQAVPHDAALVIGGGIAGMRAAIDLADAGVQVHLVERMPTLGGKMDYLDTTFPTQNCTLCRSTSAHGVGCPRPSIAPYFLEHLQRPEIQVHTLAELVALDGEAGAFTATVRQHPRYVDVDRCTACGDCRAVCPVELPDDYNAGLTRRRAIDRPSPQAIPRAYVLSPTPNCATCRRCVEVCPTQAIDLGRRPRDETLAVGAVIVATGYRVHNADEDAELGHGRYANVVTGLELERLMSGPGPTCGLLRRPSDGREPKRVAFLQCVGSRDQKHAYCSSVCCMYALKEAMLVKDRLPKAQVEMYLMDMRTFNKGHIETLERARDGYGVTLTHCRISGLKEDPASRDVLVRYVGEDGALAEKSFDLVVLSTGLEPAAGAAGLFDTLGIEANVHGFCAVDRLAPWRTSRPGVYACGAAVEPQDIPESVTQAAAAAAEAAQMLARPRSATPEEPLLQERDVTGEAPRTGVFVCHCGTEIDAALNVAGLVRAAHGLENVAYATDLPYACLPSGRDAIAEAVRAQGLNRVVVAACSPRAYEGFFRDAARRGGINAYLVEMANIREQGAWAHPGDPGAQAQAEAALRAAVARAGLLRPLQAAKRTIERSALVVGGGVAGLTAALSLAGRGIGVTLLEREDELGGQARGMVQTADRADVPAYLSRLAADVAQHPGIEVLRRSTPARIEGEPGNWTVHVATAGAAEMVGRRAGAIVLATGGREYRGDDYLLGQHPQVMTQRDLERAFGSAAVSAAKRVVMIQCVAPDRRCSRVCCTQALANARRLRAQAPGCSVHILYQDVRTYGFDETLYTAARQEGILFDRYERAKPPRVERDSSGLRVRLPDLAMGGELSLRADLVVLSTAILPAEGAAELASSLGVPVTAEGYLAEAHPKLRPVEALTESVFMCGLAHYPKHVDESIAQAEAAAGKAAAYLAQGVRWGTPVVAVVDADKCVGCLTCVRLCPYEVPKIDPHLTGNGGIVGAARIDPARCQGCGLCAGECPAKAIQLEHYRDVQVLAAVQGALSV